MIQTTVKISGMACSMCEAHINDTIRRTFSVVLKKEDLTRALFVLSKALEAYPGRVE